MTTIYDDSQGDEMNDPKSPPETSDSSKRASTEQQPSDDMYGDVLITGILEQIQDAHIEAMTRTLAHILVDRALTNLGIRASNDNE